MLSNILRIVPTARTEKNQPQALPKHQFFAACPDAHTVTTHTVTAVAPQQSQSELYGHTADELYGQNSSDYSVRLSPPLVTLRPLHQDFTQSPGSTLLLQSQPTLCRHILLCRCLSASMIGSTTG
ncbi:MAG: hypothetical protein EDM05_003195 [Leptolyngbya sp. IPPAS B-1204]